MSKKFIDLVDWKAGAVAFLVDSETGETEQLCSPSQLRIAHGVAVYTAGKLGLELKPVSDAIRKQLDAAGLVYVPRDAVAIYSDGSQRHLKD